MYRIEGNHSKGVLIATLSGMMTVAEVGSYIDDVKRAFVAHRLRQYSMVIDVSACPIQHQDVIQAMGEHMASMPKATALAVVTGSSLAKMQVRRLFTQPYARIVDTVADGVAWVSEGREPPAR